MRRPLSMLWLGTLGAVACAGDPAGPTTMPGASEVEPTYPLLQDARAHAARASLALRGLRPSAEELAAVEADPNALPALVDAWLETDAFGDTVADYHAELLLVRADIIEPLPAIGPLEGHNLHELSLIHI